MPGCGAWQYARQAEIPTYCYPQPWKVDPGVANDAPRPKRTDELIYTLMEPLQVQYVILAGYLKVKQSAAHVLPT